MVLFTHRYSGFIAFMLLLGSICEGMSESTSAQGTDAETLDSNSTAADAHHGASHVHASAQEIGFLTICIFIGVMSRKCLEPKICMRLVPYTVILLGVGGSIGMISIYTQFDDSKGESGQMNRFCSMSPEELIAHEHSVDLGCNKNISHDGCACLDAWGSAKVNILHNLSPHVILFVFLPPLIFESAFFMDFHIFVRSIVGISSLAVLGVTIATFVTGSFLMLVVSDFRTNVDYSPLKDFSTAMMLGSMLSATDPVAVVQLLKSLGASPKLGTLIEGESLLNDGTAYAMFLIFKAQAVYGVLEEYQIGATCGNTGKTGQVACSSINNDYLVSSSDGTFIFTKLLMLVVLGPAIGTVVGSVSMSLVEVIYNDRVAEVTITILSAYTSWCVAEAVGSSGVLAVVSTGLFMSKSRDLTFEHKTQHFLHEFWELLGYLLNTFIFIFTGTIIGRKMADPANATGASDISISLLLWVWIHVARGVAMLAAQPFVNSNCYFECSKRSLCKCCSGRRISFVVYDFGWRESVVMWWGGLRGAVGLALGLIVGEDIYWSDSGDYSGIPGHIKSFYKDAVLYHVGAVAGMTLLFNGVTMGPLVKALGLNKKPGEIAIHNFERILHEMDLSLEKKISSLSGGSKRIPHHHKVYNLINYASDIKIEETERSDEKQNIASGKGENEGQNANKVWVVKARYTYANGMLGQFEKLKEFDSKEEAVAMKKMLSLKIQTRNSSPSNHTSKIQRPSIAESLFKRTADFATKVKNGIAIHEESTHSATNNHHDETHAHVVAEEFAHVKWKTVYQYLPIESNSIYTRRVERGVLEKRWGQHASNGWLSVILADLQHNWCGWTVIIPQEVKDCFSCGCMRSQRRMRIVNVDSEDTISDFSLRSNQYERSEMFDLPPRLRRRWHKYYKRAMEYRETQAERLRDMETPPPSAWSSRRDDATATNDRSDSIKSDLRSISDLDSPHRRSKVRRKSLLAPRGEFDTKALQAIELAKKSDQEESQKHRRQNEFKYTYKQSAILGCTTNEERRDHLITLRQLGAGRAEYCRAVRKQYRHLLEKGLLGRHAYRDLNDAEAVMLDSTEEFFMTINHDIQTILELQDPKMTEVAWNEFPWTTFVLRGELKTFSKSLYNLTNISSTVICLSRVGCLSRLFRRFFFEFVERARDITSNYIHAHESVVHHSSKLGITDEHILKQVICEAEFQIMEAKTVLHNIDQVFPEITHHLQTMTAVRYILHCEQEQIDGYLKAGELDEKEHERMSANVTKSLRKLLAHPKPAQMTPQFSVMMRDFRKSEETLGRVIQELNNQSNIPRGNLPRLPSIRFGMKSMTASDAFLEDFSSWATMVYLRAGDLVYEQGCKKDHTGKVGRAGMGIYFIARGCTTSCLVPGKIVLSRRSRDAAYFQQLSKLRSNMLNQLFCAEAVKNRRSIMPQGKPERRRSSLDSLSLKNISTIELKSFDSEKMNTSEMKFAPKETEDASLDRLSMTIEQENFGVVETDVTDDGDELPVLERDNMTRHAIVKSLESLIHTYAQTSEGKESVDRLEDEIPGLSDLVSWYESNVDGSTAGKIEGGNQRRSKSSFSSAMAIPKEKKSAEDQIFDLLRPSSIAKDVALKHGADLDADGDISVEEMNMYRQAQLLSADPNSPVDILDTHLENHMFGEYEIMSNLPAREHTIECRGVVIAFFVSSSHVKHLCNAYPPFETEMWRRSAVTALKLHSVNDFYNFRYESTRTIRRALQKGEVSTPKTREIDGENSKVFTLHSPDDHLFYIRPRTSHDSETGPADSKSSQPGETEPRNLKPRSHARIVSGPESIEVSGDDVVVVFRMKRKGDEKQSEGQAMALGRRNVDYMDQGASHIVDDSTPSDSVLASSSAQAFEKRGDRFGTARRSSSASLDDIGIHLKNFPKPEQKIN